MSQLAIPVDIRPEDISRKKTLGHAIELCAELAGFELDKQLQDQIGDFQRDTGYFSMTATEASGQCNPVHSGTPSSYIGDWVKGLEK